MNARTHKQVLDRVADMARTSAAVELTPDAAELLAALERVADEVRAGKMTAVVLLGFGPGLGSDHYRLLAGDMSDIDKVLGALMRLAQRLTRLAEEEDEA